MASRSIKLETNMDGYEVQKSKITRTLKTLSGEEIERKAELLLLVPEPSKAAEFFGDMIGKWAIEGYIKYQKLMANNALLGAVQDKETKALLRQFRTAHETYVKVSEMEPDAATEFLLSRPRFAALQSYFESLKSGDEVQKFDYSEKISDIQPRWFKGETPEDETEETETEQLATQADQTNPRFLTESGVFLYTLNVSALIDQDGGLDIDIAYSQLETFPIAQN